MATIGTDGIAPHNIFHIETADGCIPMGALRIHPLRAISLRYYNGQRFRVVIPDSPEYVHMPMNICHFAPADHLVVEMPDFALEQEIHVRRGPRHPCIVMYIRSLYPLRAVGDGKFIDIDERNIHQVHLPENCLFGGQHAQNF